MQANRNSALRSLLIVICLGWLPGVWAQGLGEMTLASSVNQPFRADIELLDIGDLDASQIIVELATPEEFANAGLQRPGILGSLQFDVEVTGDGTGVIHVSSTAAIEEPFLNFLISVRWPNGRMLREYTALLDLPTFADPEQAPTAPAVQTPQATAPAPAVAAPPAPSASPAGDYTVRDGDSLWQIASSVRPNNAVSVQQMMVAIQRSNADAFINNNMNRIRSGRVLRIPSSDEISVIDQATAIAAINQQNQQLASQPLAVNNTARPAASAEAGDELTLLSGNDNGGRATGAGGSDDTIAALENELMLSEEGLDRARLENLELTNRLAALQEQVDLLQNMVSLEDARIATLQTELAEQARQTEQALAEAQTAAETLASEEAASQQQSGIVGLLQNTAVLLGGGVALVLLALGVLLVRRNNTASTDEDTFDFDAAEAEARAAAAATITHEETLDNATPAREDGTGWAAAVAAFFARFRKQPDESNDDQAGQPVEEVTGGSYGPEAAFRNVADDARIEPTLQGEEEQLAAEAMAAEAIEQVATEEQEMHDEEEAALSPNGTISYVEPAFVPDDEDLLAEAGDMLAAVTPAPVEVVTDEAQQPESATAVEDAVWTEVARDDIAESAPAREAVVLEQEIDEVETPDVFEFSLRTEAAAETLAAPAVEPEPDLESVEFTPGSSETPASAHASEYQQVADLEPPAAESDDDMVDLAFDDTFIADAAEEDDSSYMPTSPNNAQDAKLDLAVAYEAMGDIDGAVDILDEVIGAGTADQIAEAERLKAKWQNS